MTTFRKICGALLVASFASAASAGDEEHWKTVTVFYAAASYADLRTTDTGLNSGRFRETNALFGDHPSDLRLYGQGAAITAGAWYGMRALRKKNPKAALVTLWMVTAVRTAVAVHNHRLD